MAKAANLQTLSLCVTDEYGDHRRSSFKATYTNDLPSKRRRPLRFMRLERCKLSSIIVEMKLCSEIREIHLFWCDDVEQLPDRVSLDALEVLRIYDFVRISGLFPLHL